MGGWNSTVDFKGKERKNDTHASTTDAKARFFKKAKGDNAHLCHLGHTLMENRHGLIVDVETTQATRMAEHEAAEVMAKCSLKPGSTLGADKKFDTKAFVHVLRDLGITPQMRPHNRGYASSDTT